MNDKRNKPAITVAELQRLFKKMAQNKGKKIKKHGNSEAILKDMQSDLNLPVVINWKNGEFEVVNKTIMRKKAFKSPDPELKYESAGEEGTDTLVKKYKKDTPMEDAVANAKDRIKAEKEADKKKHDGLLDRARLARAKAKNRSTKA